MPMPPGTSSGTLERAGEAGGRWRSSAARRILAKRSIMRKGGSCSMLNQRHSHPPPPLSLCLHPVCSQLFSVWTRIIISLSYKCWPGGIGLIMSIRQARNAPAHILLGVKLPGRCTGGCGGRCGDKRMGGNPLRLRYSIMIRTRHLPGRISLQFFMFFAGLGVYPSLRRSVQPRAVWLRLGKPSSSDGLH